MKTFTRRSLVAAATAFLALAPVVGLGATAANATADGTSTGADSTGIVEAAGSYFDDVSPVDRVDSNPSQPGNIIWCVDGDGQWFPCGRIEARGSAPKMIGVSGESRPTDKNPPMVPIWCTDADTGEIFQCGWQSA